MGMAGIASIGGVLVLQLGNGVAVIPLLGTLALGAQRLLPTLQQIYNNWSVLTSSNAAMQAVLTMLSQPLSQQVFVVEPLSMKQAIRLDSVHFSYGKNQPNVINGVNLFIRRGERIGLIGSTGSGKSTMADLLMGLSPTAGQFLVDGADLHDPEHRTSFGVACLDCTCSAEHLPCR